MGKSTISMAIFNSFLYVYQRVHSGQRHFRKRCWHFVRFWRFLWRKPEAGRVQNAWHHRLLRNHHWWRQTRQSPEDWLVFKWFFLGSGDEQFKGPGTSIKPHQWSPTFLFILLNISIFLMANPIFAAWSFLFLADLCILVFCWLYLILPSLLAF